MMRFYATRKNGVALGVVLALLSYPVSASIMRRFVRSYTCSSASYGDQMLQRRLAADFDAGTLFAQKAQPFFEETGKPYTLPWDRNSMRLVRQALLYNGVPLSRNGVVARLCDKSGKPVASLACRFQPFLLQTSQDPVEKYQVFIRAYMEPMLPAHPRYEDLHRAGMCESLILHTALRSLEKHHVHSVVAQLPRIAPKQHELYKNAGFTVRSCGHASQELAWIRDAESGLPIKIHTSCKSCEKDCQFK